MDIRLIALDLDGTLLTTDKRLTEHTKKVLARAAEQGIHIVPATGRSVTGLAPEVRGLPFVRYAITVNGAAVWDMDEERIVSRKAFSPEQARNCGILFRTGAPCLMPVWMAFAGCLRIFMSGSMSLCRMSRDNG